ncbi:hypothetical protein [Pseudomonas sp. NPDC007930]|uniref:hypothetical protein n=1 Tax=Pseudomonas sp. NPDC007930 TaxID=3364417 RepID=UPI0036E8673F
MTGWRMARAALIGVLLSVLLSGCLATFDDLLGEGEKAPPGLLGRWVARNAWGDHLNLEVRRTGPQHYAAISYPQGTQGPRDEALFRVSRHGERWYASAPLPAALGGRHGLVGFELTAQGELVIYALDLATVQQAIAAHELAGERFDTDQGQGVAVRSAPGQVFAWLDDPAHSDAFTEIARYRRAGRN